MRIDTRTRMVLTDASDRDERWFIQFEPSLPLESSAFPLFPSPPLTPDLR